MGLKPRKTNPWKQIRAKQLRENATASERRMHTLLKEHFKYAGIYFSSSIVIRGYIADFVCTNPPRPLIVELDGKYHLDPRQAKADAVRDQRLGRAGYKTVRMPSRLVFDDPAAAIARVQSALERFGPIRFESKEERQRRLGRPD